MPTYTYREALKLANAAGWDAGNRSAHRAGRKGWNEMDRDAAQSACNAVLAGLGFGQLIGE